MMNSETEELLDGLSKLGCGVQKNEGAVFVSLPDEFAEFVFDHQGEWLFVGTTMLAPEEFADSQFTGRLDRFLLELQDRSLGCHFSYDRNGFLVIGTEIHKSLVSPKQVLQTMDQIAFIIEACISFCDQVLETGQIPSDADMDLAFGTNAQLH